MEENILKTILSKILAGYKAITGKINDLINGDGIKKNPSTETTDNPYETVIVGGWKLQILDENQKCVYDKQLLFNENVEERDDIALPKIVGRYDKEYYESKGIEFDQDYDININRNWAGSKYVHRQHAWIVYHKDTHELEIKKCPRPELQDNGMYDEKGNSIEELIIKDGTVVFIGPAIALKFLHPGAFKNVREGKKETKVEKPSGNDTQTNENPGRMPGRLAGRGL